MTTRHRTRSTLRNAAVLLALSATVVCSGAPGGGTATGNDAAVRRYTVDSGGGISAGGGFAITGTTGQSDAATQFSSGSGFAVAGGFWPGRLVSDRLFADDFEP